MSAVFEALNPALRKAIAAVGYTMPTPIQAKAIPPLLKGRDLIGCAQTGTGKTAAFALPILHRLALENRAVRPCRPHVLILAPTRELVAQIGENVEAYARFQKTPSAVVFGGVNITPQIRKLEAGVAVLVATPGRLLDLSQGLLGAVGDVHHVSPKRQAGVLVLLELPDDAGRADVVLLREGVHREEGGAVEYQHGTAMSVPDDNGCGGFRWV